MAPRLLERQIPADDHVRGVQQEGAPLHSQRGAHLPLCKREGNLPEPAGQVTGSNTPHSASLGACFRMGVCSGQ